MIGLYAKASDGRWHWLQSFTIDGKQPGARAGAAMLCGQVLRVGTVEVAWRQDTTPWDVVEAIGTDRVCTACAERHAELSLHTIEIRS